MLLADLGAYSSVWLERTPDKREVGGSNPPRPTISSGLDGSSSNWFELSSIQDAVEFSPRVEEVAVFDSGIVEMEGCLTVF